MTEDVNIVSSIDSRIFLDALQSRERRKQEFSRDLQKLRMYIHDDTINMIGRIDDRGVDKNGRAEWLHLKTYDETYQDYGVEAKHQRTRRRVEALLDLCHGDKKLLLDEIVRALNKYMPIQSPAFAWNPEIIYKELPSGKFRVSLKYRWSRVKTGPKSDDMSS